MTVFCFDLDGTLCTNTYGDYHAAEPLRWAIDRVNALHQAGHKIIIFTARGESTGIDWRSSTVSQLERWGVRYDELRMGKPTADVFVDDRAFVTETWRWGHAAVIPRPGTDKERTRAQARGIGGLAPPIDVAAVEVGRTFGGRLPHASDHVDRLLGAAQDRGVAVPHGRACLLEALRAVASAPGGALGATTEIVFTMWLAGLPDAAYLDLYGSADYPTVSVAVRPLSEPLAALEAYRDRHADPELAIRAGNDGWPVSVGTDGRVADGLGGDLAVVASGNVAIAPTAGRPTVARRQFVAAAGAVEERVLVKSDLASADELLIVNAPFCVLPVTRLEGRQVGSGRPGPVNARVRAAWEAQVGAPLR